MADAEARRAKCDVVVLAAGSGTRAGGGTPKQFRPLGGEPVLLWSVRAFVADPDALGIVVVAPPGQVGATEELVGGLGRVVAGGARRQESVLRGLLATKAGSELVAIHDGARPFPPGRLRALIEASSATGAAIFGLPVTDSLRRAAVGEDGVARVGELVERERLWATQTPQLGRRELLIRALRAAEEAGVEVTDEAAALGLIGVAAALVPGSRENIKITTPEDWRIAEALAGLRRVG